MELAKTKIDLDSVNNSTYRANYRKKSILEQAEQLTNDPEKEKRMEKHQCPICFYVSGRPGGSACSSRTCAFCEKELSSGNTCVDVLCIDCAKNYNLCVYCGGDVHLKSRRKLVPKQTKEKTPNE